MPANRTRLSFDTLDARDLPSAACPDVLPEPEAAAAPARVEAATAAQPKLMSAVTRIPPTAVDLRIQSALQNRKWLYRNTVTNPFTGSPMQITAEIVFVANGTFTLNQVGVSPGFFGPSSYYSGASGRWWVQNNGVLVLNYTQSSPAGSFQPYQFMRITSINNTRFVSPDGGTWFQIPRNVTFIR